MTWEWRTRDGEISRADAVARLTAMPDDLDFAPDPVAERIRLRRCPFLDLAEPTAYLAHPTHPAR